MKKIVLILASPILLATLAFAQNPTAPPPAPADQSAPTQFAAGTIIPAELSKSVDAKKIKVGDPFEAKTTADMLSNGKVIMPRNTRVLGHVTSVKAHTKESPDSTVGLAFDRLVMKDGHEIPLQASVQAIGAPMNAFGTGSSVNGGAPDPSAAPMGGASGGGMGGSRSGGGTPAPSSTASSGMPTSPDPVPPHGPSTGALGASSMGVIGLKDLSLSATPQASVVSSGNKNVHLDGGTQLMLKVQ